MGVQCFTDLKSILMVRRYHICTIFSAVVPRRARTYVTTGEIGAVRRDRSQSERSKARWEAIGMC